MKLPKLTCLAGRRAHGVSVRFFGGAESPEAEKEAYLSIPPRRDGFLRRGIKIRDKFL